MKESGTTGAGEPQITGVPRVHVHGHLKLVHSTHGWGTGNDSLLGRTSGTRLSISPVMTHGSMVTDGAKWFQPLMEWIPDGVVSGTQPVCEPVRCSPSEYGEDVCSDSADERSCGVSSVSCYSIVEDPAAWTRTTNDSGTDGGLFTSELQAGADLSLGSSVASDGDGTLLRCVLLVCTGQGFDGLEGVVHTCDSVGLGNNGGAEGVPGMAETSVLKFTILL